MKSSPESNGSFSPSVIAEFDPPSGRWIGQRLRQVWEVLHSPAAAFARNPGGPGFLVPLIVLSLISMIGGIIQSPLQVEWMEAQLSSGGGSPAQISETLDLMRRSVRIGLILHPLFLGARWLAYALLIWLTAQLLLVSVGYSQTLTVVAYSYAPILMRDMAACLVLCLRDRELLRQAGGLQVGLGLDILFPGIPAPWLALAGNINPFEAWFVALMVSGLGTVTRQRWQKVLAAVLIVWVFLTLLQFGFVALCYQIKNQFSRA